MASEVNRLTSQVATDLSDYEGFLYGARLAPPLLDCDSREKAGKKSALLR